MSVTVRSPGTFLLHVPATILFAIMCISLTCLGCLASDFGGLGKDTLQSTEKKCKNHLIDYLVMSCNEVSAWTSTVVARERRLSPQRAQQEAKSKEFCLSGSSWHRLLLCLFCAQTAFSRHYGEYPHT